jgi:hypothetical protein
MTRVVLHVGTPKSGTTFLQQALWLHRESLLEQGVTCPGERQREMFLGAVDVRGTREQWGLDPAAIEGRWQSLCEQAREFPGTTIMSHELLGAASRRQVKEARAALEGVEVDLVITARDLARQLVSEWQERVKNGATATFDVFAAGLTRQLDSGRLRGLFWANQHIPAILLRWSSDLPASRVHVVTAPAASANDPRELWRRYAEAVGFDPTGLDPVAPDLTANPSLGATQIAILREVNDSLDGRIPQPEYTRVVKRFLGQDVLTRHRSARPICPPDLAAALERFAEQWIDKIIERGYAVHGSLDDLRPQIANDTPGVKPDQVDDAERAEASAAVISDLLVEIVRLREEVRRLSAPPPPLPQRIRNRILRMVDTDRSS